MKSQTAIPIYSNATLTSRDQMSGGRDGFLTSCVVKK